MWYVYILKCSDKTFYTGVTNDVRRRVEEHNSSKLGSKYAKARRPVKLVYKKSYKNRSLSQKEESRIKTLSRSQKQEIINKNK
jgi:putative endonuclease